MTVLEYSKLTENQQIIDIINKMLRGETQDKDFITQKTPSKLGEEFKSELESNIDGVNMAKSFNSNLDQLKDDAWRKRDFDQEDYMKTYLNDFKSRVIFYD